jgi:hypothetical protein
MFGDYVSIVIRDKVKGMDIESTGAHLASVPAAAHTWHLPYMSAMDVWQGKL